MTERDLAAACVRWLNRQPDCRGWAIHRSGFGANGVPDVLGHVRGVLLAAELKLPGEKTTPIQDHEHRALSRTGAPWVVARSLAEFQAHVARLRDPAARRAILGL